MIKIFTALTLSLVFLAPLAVEASPVIRTGDRVSLSAEQVVIGDFYTMGATISSSGSIEGDMLSLGSIITFNGEVRDDLLALGGSVSLYGAVGDDARVLGGEVIIGDAVDGDLFVVGESLHILSTAEIKGDVLFFGGDAEIEGIVDGTVSAYASEVRIDGAVGGDIDARVGEGLVLGDRAHVSGNITHESPRDILRSPNAVVVGEIEELPFSFDGDTSSFGVGLFFATLFAALLALLVVRQRTSFFSNINTHLLKSTAIGFAAFVMIPVVAILLLVSVVGSFVGMLLILLYGVLLILSWVLGGVFLGIFCKELYKKDIGALWMWIVFGVLVLHILLLLPVIGGTLVLLIMFYGIGCLLEGVYYAIR